MKKQEEIEKAKVKAILRARVIETWNILTEEEMKRTGKICGTMSLNEVFNVIRAYEKSKELIKD